MAVASSALESRWRHLREKIMQYAELLVDQGTVASRLARGKRVESLRFYQQCGSRRIQRAIYLGADQRLVQRTQDLLEEIRRDRACEREVELLSRLCRTLVRPFRRLGKEAPRGGAEN